MRARQAFIARLGLIAVMALIAASAVGAHEMMYQGTVLAVQAAKLQVKTIDEKTKKLDTVWFAVDRDTKVKRGGKIVAYGDAKIVAGELVVVLVDHDAETKMLATEIRLAARDPR
jgi:hypothetical protein